MPDLSTVGRAIARESRLFLLATPPTHVSFQSSDDGDDGPPGREGRLQDQPEGNGPERRGSGPIPWSRNAAIPTSWGGPDRDRKCSPSLGRRLLRQTQEEMMKGFPGAAGPRKGADQTIAG